MSDERDVMSGANQGRWSDRQAGKLGINRRMTKRHFRQLKVRICSQQTGRSQSLLSEQQELSESVRRPPSTATTTMKAGTE